MMNNGYNNSKKTEKIDFGVVTFFASNNFGAVLQAYALQKKIQDLGYTTEVLNYNGSEEKKAVSGSAPLKSYFKILKAMKFNAKTYFKARSLCEQSRQKFNDFRRNNLKISRERLYDMEDLEEIESKYNALIAGSDMVWTEKGQNLEAFFLRFTEPDKRLSYAASLTGTEFLSEEKKELIGKYISEIKSISCREEEGVEFARKFGNEAFLALDPTMLLTKEDWTKALSLKKANEKYILCYCFGETTPGFIKCVKNLAKKKNLKVHYLAISLDGYAEELKNGNCCSYGPREFVEMFFNAEFIITNTFHGLIFSIIGEKPFALIRREETCKWKKNEERMLNMLRMIGQESRAITSVDSINDSFFNLDYQNIKSELSKHRELSLAYLTNMLKNTGEHIAAESKRPLAKTVADVSKKMCTGCSACANICSVDAVEMQPDDEGFLRPVADEKKCTNCGLCTRICPALNDSIDRIYPIEGYVAFSEDNAAKNSASGGAFISFAKYVVEQLNGVVYGCVMEKDTLKCVHKRAEKMTELCPMQNSKYVQSDVSECFSSVKEDLNQNRFVLFSGTPCQIAGLRSYLGRNYENLLAVDIICHGVPSPWLWKQKIDFLQKRFDNSVKTYTFRNKDNEEEVRSAFESTVECNKGKVKCKSWEDAYFKTFLDGKTYRMSCYYCKYADIYRCGDITLGDCDSWRNYPDFYPQKAKSAILVNTPKGNVFWNNTKRFFVFADLDIEGERKINKQLSGPTVMPSCRKTIYDDASMMDWESFEKKYSVKSNRFKSIVAKTIHKVVNSGKK